MTAGEKVRDARKTWGLTQRDLASMLGVDYTYISKIENGALNPGKSLTRKMAIVLNLDADELLADFGHDVVERLTCELEAARAAAKAWKRAAKRYRLAADIMASMVERYQS